MYDELLNALEKRMRSSLQALGRALNSLRTGRAHPSLLEGVLVDYHGSDVPLRQVGTISITDPRTLTVNIWERDLLGKVEKAIQAADLGLNPVIQGTTIYITVPQLTGERRQEMVKQAHAEGERGRIALRNIRRDGRDQLKQLTREASLSEDDEKRACKRLQEILDHCVEELSQELKRKEQELSRI